MNKRQQNEIGRPLRDMTPEEEREILNRFLTQLREHFDCCVILAARTNRNGSGSYDFVCSGHPLFVGSLLNQAQQEYVAYPSEEDDDED
jgi:hypothetical protein